MDLISTKIVVALLFGVLRFIFGVLPIKIYKLLLHWEEEDNTPNFINEKRHNQVRCALALCQSFGGGVLFATCFLHMMPEVYKSVEDLKQFGGVNNSDYPLSQLTISFGFFLVYFVEEISHWFITKIPAVKTCEKSKVITPNNNKITPTTPISDLIVTIDEQVAVVDEKAADIEKIEEKNERNSIVIDDVISLDSEISNDNNELSQETKIVDQVIETKAKTKQQIVRSILIVLALSLHAIFEGLAIGLQTSISNIWYLFIAISIHSATILFCIGLELLLVKTKIKTIVYHILILSITSPFGVLIGLLITVKANMNTKAKSTAIVLLEGISAGTILYIIFFEILNREKERRIFRLRRAICIVSGFGLMAILQSAELYHH